MKFMPVLTVAALVVAVVAVVIAVWASAADAPWEDDAPTVVVEDSPKFSEAEVISLVRTAVSPSECSRAWEAEYQGDGVWYVGTNCGTEVNSMDPRTTISAVWSFRESGERLIPLNGFARQYSP